MPGSSRDPTPPENPKGWGERVSFGAQEDTTFMRVRAMWWVASDTTTHEMARAREWRPRFTGLWRSSAFRPCRPQLI